jgi:hypothetical protein
MKGDHPTNVLIVVNKNKGSTQEAQTALSGGLFA